MTSKAEILPVIRQHHPSKMSNSLLLGGLQQILFTVLHLHCLHRFFEILILGNRGSVTQSFDIGKLFHEPIKKRPSIRSRTTIVL